MYRFDETTWEVQKFNKSLIEIEGWNPTGVDSDFIFCTAVARHLGKLNLASPDSSENNMYTFKTFNIAKWKPHVARKVLHNCEKFEPRARVTPPARDRASQLHVSDLFNVSKEGNESLEDLPQEVASAARAPSSQRVQGGLRAAKESAERAFRDKQWVSHLGEISSSLKRKSDTMEDSNALVLFRMGLSEQRAENVAQGDAFLRNLRAKYAEGARKATAAAAAAENNIHGTSQGQGIDFTAPYSVSGLDIDGAAVSYDAAQFS